MSKKQHYIAIRDSGRAVYPFFEMAVGDYFYIPPDKVLSCRAAFSHLHARYKGLRFRTFWMERKGAYRCVRVDE
jgi:hypothetical protein